MFALGLVAGATLPRAIVSRPPTVSLPVSEREAPRPWDRSGNSESRHVVTVVRVIDGDTFEAQVHLWPGLEMTSRIRLRGIDAPELKARCPDELQRAQQATAALSEMLGQGSVTIFNIGPDKYNGRVVADAATPLTPNVSAALLAAGHARSYGGGHRDGWCASASR